MADSAKWQSTACILCSTNRGLHVQIADGHFTKVNPTPWARRSDRASSDHRVVCVQVAGGVPEVVRPVDCIEH